ncbi:MAG: YdcF family protein [candidate division WOR-3 bacterium]|nr:YdcF family protein [candidate division WOR-3 bacterium]
MVNDNLVVIFLGSNHEKVMEERIKFGESMIKYPNRFKVIFSGTSKEVDWMKSHSNLKGIAETQSKTTLENLVNSKELIDTAERIWIITDKTHAFRTKYLAGRIFRNTPFEIFAKKMPPSYRIKRIWYEGARLIRNVFQ